MNLAVAIIVAWLATTRLCNAEETNDDYPQYMSGDSESANTTNCTNLSCVSDEEYLNIMVQQIFPKEKHWVLIVMHSIVFMVGLIGNVLVCLAVCRNHSMHTVTNYFLVNLAVADILVLLICLPPSVLWDVTETWFFGLIPCKAVPYLQTVSVSVSILTLTFISIDRWYAICFPLRFKSTTGRATTAIILIWVISLLFDIPELLVLHTVPSKSKVKTVLYTQCVWSWSNESQTIFTIVKFIFLYTIPLLFMSMAYWQIIRVLWKSDIPGHTLSTRICNSTEIPLSGCGNPEGQLRSRRKAAKMLVVIIITFAICFLPVHLLSILRCIMNLPSEDWTIIISLIVHWLCYFNSAVNPVIYNFMSGKFRKEFRRTFRCSHNNRTCGHKRGYVAGAVDSLKYRSQNHTRSIQTTVLSNNNNVQQSTEIMPLNAIINVSENEKQELKSSF